MALVNPGYYLQERKRAYDWPVILFVSLIHIMALATIVFFASWQGFFLALFLSFVTTCLGITLGFHRLFSHRAFKVVKPLERFLAICGTLAMQGTLRDWVGHHRMHHAGADTEADPHNARVGFWHSHIGWIFYLDPEYDDAKKIKRYTRDIDADPFLKWISGPSVMIWMQVAFAAFLFMVGFFLGGAMLGVEYVMWGSFFRLFYGYHITWLVNSAAHKWGYQNFKVNDLATNCWWVGILAWGEGWHNNHHAYGNSVRSGYKWWEFDLTYCVIVLFKWFGLAYDLRYTMPGQGPHMTDRVQDQDTNLSQGSSYDADILPSAAPNEA